MPYTYDLPPLPPGQPVPAYLSDAFVGAWAAIDKWPQFKPEPQVTVRGQPIPIGAVFGALARCTDPLPADRVAALRAMLPAHRSLEGTYAGAARRLKEVVDDINDMDW